MTTPPSFFDQLTVTQWISIAQVAATALVGLIAGVITWVMQSKQIDIAKGLKGIALAQHETAATKLRLELFEKRFKAYEEVLSHIKNAINYDYYENPFDIDDLIKKHENSCEPIKFLFNQNIHNYLKNDVANVMKDYLYAANAYGHKGRTDADRNAQKEQYTSTYERLIGTAKGLDEIVSSYLIIEIE